MQHDTNHENSDAPTLENIIKMLVAAGASVVGIAGGMYFFYKFIVFVQT
ncbi:MAG: hypothetical protein JNL01_16030 [Bdellovibrionales bacterium]|nr:hypothetical protein [Bdellovibrionales bacterium]